MGMTRRMLTWLQVAVSRYICLTSRRGGCMFDSAAAIHFLAASHVQATVQDIVDDTKASQDLVSTFLLFGASLYNSHSATPFAAF